MAVRVIIGDYKVDHKKDIIISQWRPECVKKTKAEKKQTIVLYAEFLGLTRSDFEYIAKSATADVIVICETRKTMNGVRKSKNMNIEYSDDYCEEMNPFDVAKMILTMKDRDYVYGFLTTNKVQMFMVVRALVSASPDCVHKSNVAAIAWLDQFLMKVPNNIIYTYAAYKIKPEKLRFIKWRYPRKSNSETTES